MNTFNKTTRFFERQNIINAVEELTNEGLIDRNQISLLTLKQAELFSSNYVLHLIQKQSISVDQIVSLNENERVIFKNRFILKLIDFEIFTFEKARTIPLEKIDQMDSVYNSVVIGEMDIKDALEMEDYFFASDDHMDYLLVNDFITAEKLEALSEEQVYKIRRIAELITNEIISLDEVIQLPSEGVEKLNRLFKLVYNRRMAAKEAISCTQEEVDFLYSDEIDRLIFQKNVSVKHILDLFNARFHEQNVHGKNRFRKWLEPFLSGKVMQNEIN